MTPTRNIYVKEGDRDIWDHAQQIAGGNLSSLITRLLADYVEGARQDEEKLQKVIKRLAKKGIGESRVREIARRFDPHYGIRNYAPQDAEKAIEAIARGKGASAVEAAVQAVLSDKALAPAFVRQALQGLQSLPPVPRQVLVSVYLEGHSEAEVAKAFGRPRAWVESTIEKGLRTLRGKMAEQDETRARSGRGAKKGS
jgi:DNA-directed RNA polymerase specialized sigma24 family protein